MFKITFKDVFDGGVITEMTGKLFTGGGIDALEATYGKNFSAIEGSKSLIFMVLWIVTMISLM